MDTRNDETRSRRWLVLLAACCLVFQAAASGPAIGACALPAHADAPPAAVHALGPPGEAPDGSDHPHHGPDCCFFACHLLAGKVAHSSAEIVLPRAEPARAGLTGPEQSLGDAGRQHLPQNPRAPPLPA